METLPLPDKYNVKSTGANQADITIEPCYPGYGTTIGNAIRRVLLSSLTGAAVTAVKFSGATHEFTTLPGVKEDIVEILLNLKRLRFKLHATDEAIVTLKTKGKKKVTAKEITLSSDVELMSPSAEIATLTDTSAVLEMELTIKKGRGYVPVESTDTKKLPLGTIAVDAIYSPIQNVNYTVENVRVGQMTNYDRVILSISTDGTLTPEEAVKTSAEILTDHFNAVQAFSADAPLKEKATEESVADTKKKAEDPAEDESEGDKSAPKKDTKKAEIEPSEDKPKKKRGRPKKES